jgi:hypothetical protein
MAYHYRDVAVGLGQGIGNQADWISTLRNFLTDVALAWTENDWSAQSGTGSIKASGTITINDVAWDVGDKVTITNLNGVVMPFFAGIDFDGANVNAAAVSLRDAINNNKVLSAHYISTSVGAVVTITALWGGAHFNATAMAEVDGATNNFTLSGATFGGGADGAESSSIMFMRTSGATKAYLLFISSWAWSEFGFASQEEFETEFGYLLCLSVASSDPTSNGWDDEVPACYNLNDARKSMSNAAVMGVRALGYVRLCANEDRLVMCITAKYSKDPFIPKTVAGTPIGAGSQTTYTTMVYAGLVTPSDSADTIKCAVIRNVDPSAISDSTLFDVSKMIGASGTTERHIEKVWGFPKVMHKAGPLWVSGLAPNLVGGIDYYLSHIEGYSDFGLDRIPARGQSIPYSKWSSPAEVSIVNLTVLVNMAQESEVFDLIGVSMATKGLPMSHEFTDAGGETYMIWPTAPFAHNNSDCAAVAIGTAI